MAFAKRFLVLVVCAACGSEGAAIQGAPDASTGDALARDAGSDAFDAATDAAFDASTEAASDATTDATSDAAFDAASDSGSTSPPGAGQTTYMCPPGAMLVKPTDDLESAITGSKAGDTICIQGEHRTANTVSPKSNQTWIGIGTNAIISGAAPLAPWTKSGSVWVYSGSLAQTPPHTMLHYAGATLCFQESQYQDDVFIRQNGADSQRLFRVLSLGELTGTGPLSDNMVQPSIEPGRFFFDYANDKIYISIDPTNATVDLALVDMIIGQSGSPSNVKLENLFVEKGRTYGIAADNAKDWTLEDMTVRFSHNMGMVMSPGTSASNRTLVEHSLFTNNGQYGINSVASWVLLKNDEISWNNIASYRDGPGPNCSGYYAAGAVKFVQSGGSATAPGLWLDGVESHHNIGDGFWTDVHNSNTLVENSNFHDNERNGYFHEISCDIEMRNNVAHGNGLAIMNADLAKQGWGIFVSDSSNANVHDNTVWNNTAGGVQLELAVGHSNMIGIPCISPAPSSSTDTTNALKNNQVHDNTVYSCVKNTAGADENASTAATSLLAPRNNTFTHNAYHVPDAGTWWVDINARDWSEWQSVDTTGTLTPSCSYP